MHWKFRLEDDPSWDASHLARKLEISPLLVRLLRMRGLSGAEEMQTFLNPGLRHLAPPEEWPGVEDAARTMAQALTAGKNCAVWGDYDVDGVTSTALMLDFLAGRGFDVGHHLPDRMGEGYGLNEEGIEALAARGVGLLLTVDCGISNVSAIARAKELGMTVVVSDHHLPGEALPPADAICNPRLSQCPCPDLAGVGVAFFLAAALNKLLPGEPTDMRRFLDLVALGTLADVVSLRGQNRILTKNGLLLLCKAERPGIAALKEASGFAAGAFLEGGHVGFGLAPRINAAGRMGHAQTALDMLLAPDMATATPLAKTLDELNRDRRRLEQTILEEALAQAENWPEMAGLVLCDPEWHSGVIGIVASRVAETRNRPTLMLCEENGRLKGSGRSAGEIDLHTALGACSELLLGFGGHRQAAGLRLAQENLDSLRLRFHEAVASQIGDAFPEPCLSVDGELGFGEVDFTLLKELELLQPFGPGNPEPVFVSPPLEVRGRRVFGTNHAALDLRDDAAGVTLKGKAWRRADDLPRDTVGKRMRVAYTPKIDRYNGLASIDLQIRDWDILT